MKIVFLLSLLLTGLLILSPTAQSSCHHPIEGHPKGNLTLTKKGCTSKTIQVKMCEGECSSVCFPRYYHGEVVTTTICHGCRPKEMVVKHETLQCGSKTRTVKYKEPVKCECDFIGECSMGLRKRRSVRGIEAVQVMRPVRSIIPRLKY